MAAGKMMATLAGWLVYLLPALGVGAIALLAAIAFGVARGRREQRMWEARFR